MFSVLMGVASLELLVNSSRDIADSVVNGPTPPLVGVMVWVILGTCLFVTSG